MVPDTVRNYRPLAWVVCFLALTLTLFFSPTGEGHAATDKLSPQVTNCVSQNVIVTLYKTPEATRLKEFYKSAVVACNKQ